jgi:ParB/RepB/Spo0J family partition protein
VVPHRDRGPLRHRARRQRQDVHWDGWGPGSSRQHERDDVRIREVIDLSSDVTGTISYADMLWLPLVKGWRPDPADLVFIDEAQDMTASQLKLASMVRRSGGRIVVVGDDRQCIFSFRGADPGSLARMTAELRAESLKLTVSFRCAQAIVAEAKPLVPDLEAAPGAIAGVVRTTEEAKLMAGAAVGDFILSRTNAPLARICLGLIRAGTPARITGKEIGPDLVKIVRKVAKGKNVGDEVASMITRLMTWRDREVARANAAKREARAEYISDQADTIIAGRWDLWRGRFDRSDRARVRRRQGATRDVLDDPPRERARGRSCLGASRDAGQDAPEGRGAGTRREEPQVRRDHPRKAGARVGPVGPERNTMAEQVVKPIRVQHLHRSNNHHRTNRSHIQSLSSSISDIGIIDALKVRPRKAGGYEVIDGMCRLEAATMAELKTVPCVVLDVDDETALVMHYSTSMERAGLHPIDEAGYFSDLHELGMDHHTIAKKLGVKKADVVRKMRLLALGPAARKAYVSGKVDDAAAYALATRPPAQQNDVIAALDAGAIVAEDIPGHIAREFTAALDDVPWRMSDEKLVAKAGACTTCPKRSDVQKELFEGQKGLSCLDVPCFRSKMEATWKIEKAKPGATVIEDKADDLFHLTGDRPAVLKSTGYVDSESACPYMIGHTWGAAVYKSVKPDAEQPTVYLARDQDGRPRTLMRESLVVKLVRKSPEAQKLAAEHAAADPVRADPAGPTPRAEGKVRRLLVQRFAELVISEDHNTLEWCASRIVEQATNRSVTGAAGVLVQAIGELGIDGLDGKAGLLALARSSPRSAKRVMTAVMVFEEADVIGEIGPQLHDLASICKVDLASEERSIRKVSP